MRMYAVKDVKPDMILGKSIYLANNQLLLAAGYRITSHVVIKLVERGYRYIYIMDKETEEIVPEDVISEEIRIQAGSELENQIDQLKKLTKFRNVSREKAKELIEQGYLSKVNLPFDVHNVVDGILTDMALSGTRIMSTIMFKSKDTFFVEHAINTAVLSILLGYKYRFEKDELKSQALGTFLHDIGKIIIDQLKGHDNPQDTKVLYREHPTFGYLLLSNNPFITPVEKQIVNQHHERQDGNGFPIGLMGNNQPPIRVASKEQKGHIYRMAEICAVADAYDRMVFNPFEKKQLSPQEAMKNMIMNSGNVFNKDIIKTLGLVVSLFPVGAMIMIVDIIDTSLVGYRGVVVKQNNEDLSRPVIIVTTNKYGKKIKPFKIDTSELGTVELQLLL